MRYVLVCLALGLIWAAMQMYRGKITEFPALAGPVLVFLLFGVLMWGVRVVLLRLRRGRQGGSS